MNKVLLILIILSLGMTIGFVAHSNGNDFNTFSPQEKQSLIVAQRDTAIQEAKDRGDYRCCIEPACTMCFMEANKWNYFNAGTCACDDFIAKGQDPCPQCKNISGQYGANSCDNET